MQFLSAVLNMIKVVVSQVIKESLGCRRPYRDLNEASSYATKRHGCINRFKCPYWILYHRWKP